MPQVKTHKITLVKPDNAGFGFSIRGGVEHKIGIYVSEVEVGSEAHLNGLQPGDQITKICGVPLASATHKEAVALILGRSRLVLKVTSGGVIPVKVRRSEPVTWSQVRALASVTSVTCDTGTMKTARSDESEAEQTEARLTISLQGQQGLGCSICKGPAEKPGIFIQSTKAGRLAREAGLRPGDQILECNKVSFRNIEFGDAVFHLKSSRRLELVVRKRAGLELFPSESSGYDSSASSSLGEGGGVSPGSSHSGEVRDINHNKVKISVGPPDPPTVTSIPQNTRNQEEAKRRLEAEIEEERRRLHTEQERLKREAEALVEERKKLEEEKKILRNTLGKSSLVSSKSVSNLHEASKSPAPASSHNNVGKSPSTISDESASSGSSGSLAAALQLEIRRRKQKAAVKETPEAGVKAEPKSVPSAAAAKKAPFITDKNEKHDMLIAEFKKAHRKMFTSTTESSEEEKKTVTKASPDLASAPPEETRPRAPPPPPVRTASALYTPTSSSSESLGQDRTDTLLTVLHTPAPAPQGIPTPDYDSTPDRSPPPSARKMFTKHRAAQSKHITPPTVESIQRAKSLTALNKLEDDDRNLSRSGKSKAPAPNPLRAADSMTELRISPPRPRDPPPSIPSKASPASTKSSQLGGRSSAVSSFQPEFFKRHPELDMESFVIGQTTPRSEARPPSTYFDPSPARASPSVSLGSYQSQSESRRFEFLPKPCDPSKLPVKQSGEEARIASKDYRGTINSNKIYTIGDIPPTQKAKSGKSENKMIRELSEKTARSFGLKKAPAPMPPVLRK